MAPSPAPESDEPLLLFRAGGERLGLPARLVSEVTRVPRLTPVPQAPERLIGLANIRGAATPVLSTTALLDAPVAAGERLVVLTGDGPVGLLVDDVDAIGRDTTVRRIDPAALIRQSRSEATVRQSTRRLAAEPHRSREEQRIALLSLHIGAQEFALPLDRIEAVIRYPATVTAMIEPDPAVIGMTGWRNMLLPILSLAALTGLDDGVAAARAVVIVRGAGGLIGLAVTAMAGVLRVTADTIDPLPPVLARSGGEARIQAVCRLDGGRRLVSILSPDQLVHGVQQSVQAAAMPTDRAAETSGGGESLLFFSIGSQELALSIAAVREVTSTPSRLTRLPRTAPFVAGLMNRRGHALPVIDLTRRLTGKPARGRACRVIVVRIGSTDAGLLVDRVSDVRRLPAEAFQPAPEAAFGDPLLFERVATKDDEMVLVASAKPLLDEAERQLLAELAAA